MKHAKGLWRARLSALTSGCCVNFFLVPLWYPLMCSAVNLEPPPSGRQEISGARELNPYLQLLEQREICPETPTRPPAVYRSRLPKRQRRRLSGEPRASAQIHRERAWARFLTSCCELDFPHSAGLVAIRWGFAQCVMCLWTLFPFALLSSMDGLKPIQTR